MTAIPRMYERPSVWMTRRYVVALVLVAVLVASGLMLFLALATTHEKMLEVVNISGRQRMLSQRIALYVERLVDGTCQDETRRACQKEIRIAVESFEAAHQRLLQGWATAMEPGLDRRVRVFVAATHTVLTLPPDDLTRQTPAVRAVSEGASGPLLLALDRTVRRYQLEGEQALRRLQWVETAVVALTLLTLVIEAALIFAPMVRRMQRQIDHIDAISADLQESNRTLEARVEQRTRELNRARAEAVQANQSKSRFLAAAGHDMLQPLQAGEMFVGLLSGQPMSDRALQMLDDLARTQKSLRHLVDSVLEVSRLEAGVVRVTRQRVSVDAVLDDVVAEMAPWALKKEIRLNIVATGLEVESDPRLLIRIMRNLVANAVRYTDSGGVVLGARRRGDAVRIDIVDSGRGIAEADCQRIFDEFVQVEQTGRDRSEGIGLGLAIVDRLCVLLGHQVSVCSREGQGSRFSVLCHTVSCHSESA